MEQNVASNPENVGFFGAGAQMQLTAFDADLF